LEAQSNSSQPVFHNPIVTTHIEAKSPSSTVVISSTVTAVTDKKIVVSGPDELHYQDILAFSELPREVKDINEIKFYWTNDSSGVKQEVSFEGKDYNENGLIDSIEQVKKNTKKTCIIQMDNDLDFNISFKKEGSFYIYIITPIIGN
jgi:hypothetical protein